MAFGVRQSCSIYLKLSLRYCSLAISEIYVLCRSLNHILNGDHMNSKAQMLIRLPVDLKMRLKLRAQINNRTVTGEVIALLERACPPSGNG